MAPISGFRSVGEGWEPLKTPRSTRAARSSVPIRSLLRGRDRSGRPPGDHAWDAETAEWAGQVHVPRQPHMHDTRVIFVRILAG